MNERDKFIDYLLEALQQTSYLFLDQMTIEKVKSEDTQSLKILILKSDLDKILPGLKTYGGMKQIKLASRYKSSPAIFTLESGAEILVDFVHKFVHKSVVYLDDQDLLNRRIKNREGLFQMHIEHAFEYAILNNFLNDRGIKDDQYRLFNDLHFLIREDLVEFFNSKYATAFSSLIGLTDFKPSQKLAMIKSLEQMPVNKFVKKVNVRWHNFVGYMRQARVI